jgi:hypothetical protein
VAPGQSEAFAQALGRAGRAVTLEILPAHGHFALIHPHSPAYPVLTGVLAEVLAP